MSEKRTRTVQMMKDRFGLFIHWGLYAIPARGEWVRSTERISNETYQTYFDEFDAARYNPREWAKAAKTAGQKYAVLTTKHHDGFCLFDSKLTEYKAVNTLAGRDLVREYVDAFRAEGISVGFYYSVIDWYHPDYPAYGDRIHPERGNEAFKDKEISFDRYLEYMHGQVKELLTNYGKIDILWFDFSYDDMTGEKWKATELINMVRSIQPDIIIDNRLGGNLLGENAEVYAGDFYSPEQIIPPGGVVDARGESVPWEACITLNENWGYHATDKAYKSPKQVIRALVECVSKNGNMLLNVGPDAKGEIPKESLSILAEVGEWMRLNGDSIYNCGAAELPKPEWGRYTQNGNKLYAHVFDKGIGPIYFQGLKGRIKKARLLRDGTELFVQTPWMAEQYSDIAGGAFIVLKGAELPDELDTVIELELLTLSAKGTNVMTNPLVEEYRGDLLENIHYGHICGVDESKRIKYYSGDPTWSTYMRSAAKPMQAIPVFLEGYDETYGFSGEEKAIMMASHRALPYHVHALESILHKLGLQEDTLICKPTYPLDAVARDTLVSGSQPPRRLYHNCSGKHLGVLAYCKGKGISSEGYYDAQHPAQLRVKDIVAQLAEMAADDIRIGTDGCGFPVFGMPLQSMAVAFLKLACPDLIEDERLRDAVQKATSIMNAYPTMISADYLICSNLLMDANIIAKGGAKGVYCFALRRERLAFALKVIDGSEEEWPLIVASILEQIDYENKETIARMRHISAAEIRNDNDLVIGTSRSVFKLEME